MSRLGAVAADHVARPRNAGTLPRPDAAGRAENPACGDVVALEVAVDAGRVSAARFTAEGCAATRAAGSALTELVLGRPVAELAAVDAAAVEAALGGLPASRYHAAEVAARAARRAARAWVSAR